MTESLCCEAVMKLKKPSSAVKKRWIRQLFFLISCRHSARYHHLVMWKTRHRQAHSLKPKVNSTWEIKNFSRGLCCAEEMAAFPGEAAPLFVSGEKHCRRLFKAAPLIRSDPLTCAIHFPSGRRRKSAGWPQTQENNVGNKHPEWEKMVETWSNMRTDF